jgi:signal transduction histidine kinase
MAGVHGDRAVLVRDRARILPGDRALLLASEAQANRHVLNGLVHSAKGPLNNFHLTLALLAAGAARTDASVPDVLARRKRYVDVLRSEVTRLSACIDEIHALTLAHDPLPSAMDLAAMTRDCARVLRHGATMREVRLDVDAPDAPVIALGDAQLVRLAFLSFAIAMIELTSANGRVGWRVAASDGEPASVVFDTTEPSLPPAFCAALFRLSCTTESEYAPAIAARLVIEAQRGDVIVQDHGEGRRAILLRIPARD